MQLPGPIAKRAVAEALANVGVTEVGGNNRGPAVEKYLASVGLKGGDPWCAAFVRFRFEDAAKDLSLTLPSHFPDSGWTPDYKTWAIEKGLYIPVRSTGYENVTDDTRHPMTGDLALFYFAAKSRIAHIGMVLSVHSWGVWTVEGNTGAETGEVVQREGDGVYKKKREWTELGSKGGFARCPF